MRRIAKGIDYLGEQAPRVEERPHRRAVGVGGRYLSGGTVNVAHLVGIAVAVDLNQLPLSVVDEVIRGIVVEMIDRHQGMKY
jgi:hypothetical protein